MFNACVRFIRKNKLIHRTLSFNHFSFTVILITIITDNRKRTKKKEQKNRAKISNYFLRGKCIVTKGTELSSWPLPLWGGSNCYKKRK